MKRYDFESMDGIRTSSSRSADIRRKCRIYDFPGGLGIT